VGVVVFPPQVDLRLILIWTTGQKVAQGTGQAVGVGWQKEIYRR
jgi:hypothetical protein